jgi:hypothetical protein
MFSTVLQTVLKGDPVHVVHLCFLASAAAAARTERTECGIAASVLHAEVALTRALPHPARTQEGYPQPRYCIPKNSNNLNSRNVSNEADKAIVVKPSKQSW